MNCAGASLYVPYGCWGTIIPEYVIDLYGSTEPVRYIYLISLCTLPGGSYVIGSWLAPKFYRWGFQWRWWTLVSALCFCGGLLLLSFGGNRVLLGVAIASSLLRRTRTFWSLRSPRAPRK